jgi:hypothetical protein
MTPFTPHAHGVSVGPDLVFLDVSQDAYVCLPGAGAAIIAPGDAAIETTDQALLGVLQQAGLTGSTLAPRHMAPRAVGELPRARQPVSGGDVRGGMVMTWPTARRYRGRFANLIAWGQCADASLLEASTKPCETARRIAHRFQRRWPWAVGRGQCLHRAFLLLSQLRAGGCDAAWVFGVRTYPFEAHCWLQIGDTVLDDPIGRLAAYQPLFTA